MILVHERAACETRRVARDVVCKSRVMGPLLRAGACRAFCMTSGGLSPETAFGVKRQPAALVFIAYREEPAMPGKSKMPASPSLIVQEDSHDAAWRKALGYGYCLPQLDDGQSSHFI